MSRNRILFVGIPVVFLLLGLVFYRYGYLKVRAEIASTKEEQAISAKTLEKYIALIEERPQLEKKIVLLTEARKADNAKLIEGQTLSLAAATLQDAVKGIVTGRGGAISSERVGKSDVYGKFKVITTSVDSVLPDSAALRDILYAVETQTPYLVVKELDVRVRDFRNPKELMTKIDISALTTAK